MIHTNYKKKRNKQTEQGILLLEKERERERESRLPLITEAKNLHRHQITFYISVSSVGSGNIFNDIFFLNMAVIIYDRINECTGSATYMFQESNIKSLSGYTLTTTAI